MDVSGKFHVSPILSFGKETPVPFEREHGLDRTAGRDVMNKKRKSCLRRESDPG